MLTILSILALSYIVAQGLTLYKDNKIDELREENRALQKNIEVLKTTIGLTKDK
jgi:hypothetical protein